MFSEFMIMYKRFQEIRSFGIIVYPNKGLKIENNDDYHLETEYYLFDIYKEYNMIITSWLGSNNKCNDVPIYGTFIPEIEILPIEMIDDLSISITARYIEISQLSFNNTFDVYRFIKSNQPHYIEE